MEQQLSFSDSEFSQKRRKTRREYFLERMEDSLYEIASMRLFSGLSLDRAVPFRINGGFD